MKRIAQFAVVALLLSLASSSVYAVALTRGPYLQVQTSDGVTIHWRTDIATESVVRYGTAPASLDQTATVTGSRLNHAVQLTGLAAAQQYWYSVGDSTTPLAGDSSYHFHTAPPAGVPADTRIWVIGDSGTADANARAVRDAYQAWAASSPADFWLMLGDNAYNNGTDAEFQSAVFNTYPDILRQLPLWLTLGNHDGANADSATQTGPYYDIFNLPKNGEAGGLASGTEAYYSFDYANIHFICLDSYDTDRSANGTMMLWLESDLATNTQPWVIAFWHHPPYSKGSHNSDTEAGMIDMRQIALPILEAWGVDLVLTGHSHSYERSYLLDGHYGISTTLDPVNHVLNPGDGRVGGTGAYHKPAVTAAQHAGAVYAVAGSSGKISGGLLNHPAMFVSLNSLGSMVVDVSGNRLDAVFLDQAGAVRDSFTLLKTPDAEPPLITAATAEDATHVLVDFNEVLDSAAATNPANYTIAGLAVSQAELLASGSRVRLTTSAMGNGTSYTLAVSNVQDLFANTILAGSTVNFSFYERVTVAFQDGLAPDPAYAGTRDAYIRQATPTTAYGLQTSLQVDGDEPSTSTNDMNILLAWDLGQIPAGSVIESANIRFEVTNISTGTYSCYGLLAGWAEAQTTWNQASTATPWTSAGATSAADRDSTPLCTVSAPSVGALTVPLNGAGIARVQSWVDAPTANHGLVISNPATSDGADFHSSESATALARPRLEVTYRVNAPPPNNYPVASFLFDCNDLDCTFSDTSSDSDGTLAAWSWNFGDGATSVAQNPVHSYAAAGDYTLSLTVTDNEGATNQAVDVLTVSAPPTGPLDVFNDSFENGQWNGLWTEDAQNDWFTSTQRATAGASSAEVDGTASDAQLISIPIDLQGRTTASISFNWYMESSLDSGEYLAFDVSTDGGSSWTQQAILRGNVDPENAWRPVLVELSGISSLRLRFRGRMSASEEDANVDAVSVIAGGEVSPPNQAPVAAFSSACTDLACSFTDQSTDGDGSLVARAWDFGDGTTSTAQNPAHSYGSGGSYTVTLTVTDDDGASDSSSATVTVTAPPTGALQVFSDSFENGQWNGLWTEDAQNDWFTSTQRATAGSSSAEVDGSASDAQLISIPINLQGRTSASISFNWYMESSLDSGEYLAFDVSTNGGSSWTQQAILRGNVDPEDSWRPVQVDLNGISSLRLRFRGRMSSSTEDANVDAVSVVAN